MRWLSIGGVALGAAALVVSAGYSFPSPVSPNESSVQRLVSSTKNVNDEAIYNLQIWLNGFYKASVNVETAAEILPLLNVVGAHLKAMRYSVVNHFLLMIDYEKFSVTATMSLMRTTYAARNNIESWQHVLRQASAAIEAKGENPARVLRGIS